METLFENHRFTSDLKKEEGDMKRLRVRPGRYVELTENVNAIPAGVYKLDMVHEGTYMFSVGQNAFPNFMMSGEVRHLLRPVPSHQIHKKRTSATQFLNRYFDLLESHTATSPIFDPSKPFTCCIVSEEEARELELIE